MTRFAVFVATLVAAASSTLWPIAVSAHGGAHDAGGDHHARASSEAGVRDGSGDLHDHASADALLNVAATHRGDALVSASEPSHCPADDDGLPCACGPDRCTNPPQPLPLLAQAPTVDRSPPRFVVLPWTSAADAVASSSPAGSIGARAPPHSS
ncbi:MAG TPA: hypothetical protein VJX31_02285 [Casimicrobiaceae bacterium]|nr:hypothetical protein [Casimicrobiaceae bacterium]